jgi:glycosyltransferase involved in cell wall biosynthesis
MSPNEIVVVDDGSTDPSPDIVRSFSGVTLLRNDGKGSSVARNMGLKHTDSEFVAFLDQDDVWHPSHLRLLVGILEDRPEANTAVATAICFENGLPEYDPAPDAITGFDPWTRFPFTIGVDGPSLAVIRRESVVEIGLWEECSTGMGDALLFLKLAVLHPLQRRTGRTVGKRIHASQQWLQVRELGASYLEFRHDVMKRALAFRRDWTPGDSTLPEYKRRLEALERLRELTYMIQADQFESIPPIARRLENDLSGDPVEYIPHVFYCLMGALFKTYDADILRRERDREFLKLLEVWPDEAKHTRHALQAIIGETPHIS